MGARFRVINVFWMVLQKFGSRELNFLYINTKLILQSEYNTKYKHIKFLKKKIIIIQFFSDIKYEINIIKA